MQVSASHSLRLGFATVAFFSVLAFGSTCKPELLLTCSAETLSELLHDGGRLVSEQAVQALLCPQPSLAMRLEATGLVFPAGTELQHRHFCGSHLCILWTTQMSNIAATKWDSTS